MKILSSLEGTASAFGGQAIDGLAIQRSARKRGIFTEPAKEKTGFLKKISSVVSDDVTNMFTKGPKMLLGASHVETLDVNKNSTISTAPQEGGSFLSYNKIQKPTQFTIRMICDGTDTGNILKNMLPGVVRSFIGKDGGDGVDALKKAFMERLDKAVTDTKLYYVSMPEKLYKNINITGYRIQRAPDVFSNMLVADITLQEVRDAFTKGDLRGRYPQGDTKRNNGTVQPEPMPDASAGVKV